MKGYLFLFALLLIAAAGYGYNQNPDGCKKLGSDFVRDAKAIYLAPPDSSTPSVFAASGSNAAPAVPTVAPSAPNPAAVPPVAVVQPSAPVQPAADVHHP